MHPSFEYICVCVADANNTVGWLIWVVPAPVRASDPAELLPEELRVMHALRSMMVNATDVGLGEDMPGREVALCTTSCSETRASMYQNIRCIISKSPCKIRCECDLSDFLYQVKRCGSAAVTHVYQDLNELSSRRSGDRNFFKRTSPLRLHRPSWCLSSLRMMKLVYGLNRIIFYHISLPLIPYKVALPWTPADVVAGV